MYKFLGIPRLQLWFFSPNVCAAFLAMLALLAVGAFLWGKPPAGRRLWWLAVPAAASVILLQLLLAMTYSRGGYVALFAGLAAAWLVTRRRALIGFAATGLGAILLVANGAQRIVSMGAVGEGSIRNRFLLWRGAAGIIADHPLTGVPDPGRLYTSWYQPLWLDEEYRTMINDGLTLAANHGIGVMILYIFVPILLALTLLRLFPAKSSGRDGVGCLLGAIAAYLTAALFSTMYEHTDVSVLYGILLGLGFAAAVAVSVHRRQAPRKLDIAAALAAGVLAAGAVLIWGTLENRRLGYTFTQTSVGGREVTDAVPSGPTPRAMILFLADADAVRGDMVRRVVRPLLGKGYRVRLLEVDSGLDGLNAAREAAAEALPEATGLPVFIAGEQYVAKHAVIVAAEAGTPPAGVIAIESPAEWPFAELSPLDKIARLRSPLLLVSGPPGSSPAFEDAQALKREADAAGIPAEWAVCEELTFSETGLLPVIADFTDAVRNGGDIPSPESLF